MRGLLIAGGIAGALLAAAPAAAAENAMKVCGAKYQAAKAARTLPAGQTWNQFLAQCRASSATTAKAAPAAAAAPVVAAAKPAAPRASHLPGAQSPAMQAMHARQAKCGEEWKAAKAAGKITAGQKWPQYWSACNKRLKG